MLEKLERCCIGITGQIAILLTLDEQEWARLPALVRRHAVTVGRVTVQQLPTVYEMSHASIFPSLLESFSATPLEAMVSGTPLVASDRAFVCDVCGAAAR